MTSFGPIFMLKVDSATLAEQNLLKFGRQVEPMVLVSHACVGKLSMQWSSKEMKNAFEIFPFWLFFDCYVKNIWILVFPHTVLSRATSSAHVHISISPMDLAPGTGHRVKPPHPPFFFIFWRAIVPVPCNQDRHANRYGTHTSEYSWMRCDLVWNSQFSWSLWHC